ncbi:hypothetical protein Droror1_Dr00011238 [Drosera rotundifolia]
MLHTSPPRLLPLLLHHRRHIAAASPPSMTSSPNSLILVLAAKSTAEIELAKLVKDTNAITLADNDDDKEIAVKLYSELREEEKVVVSFDLGRYLSSIGTDRFGRFLVWSPGLNSTQDVVSKNFGVIPVGSVCVADVQFKGRGRSKNVWDSLEGCLMFSFTIQMEDGRMVPLVQYVVSLAMTETIKDVCHKNGLPILDVRIKWPNDLYMNGLKIGGILCTSTYSSGKFNICAGIGLNLDNRYPTTCLNAALQELTSTSCFLQREDIMCYFFNKFEKFFDLFIVQGFQPLDDLYCKTWLHSGQRVIVADGSEGQSVDNVVTIQGLTSSGYLLAIGEGGQMFELHPDGNSLDFFKGLVRRKLE